MAFTKVAVVPVTRVKDVFAVMGPTRVLFGMPVAVMNMPSTRPVVFVQVAVELPLVMPMVTFTGAASTLRLVVSPAVLVQVTVVLPATAPAALMTTLLSETVSAFQSSLSRVFQVAPLSEETCIVQPQLFVAKRSRVCT